MKKSNVAIIGATGYVGAELVRLFSSHPEVFLTRLMSKSYAGQVFSDIYPSFKGVCDLTLSSVDADLAAQDADVVFTALPHGIAGSLVAKLLAADVNVIDHSADFRFRNKADYEEAYKTTHPCPNLLSEAVYGIPELYGEAIAKASLVANPGCYPTSAILALAPLLSSGKIETDKIIIDAISGLSGAGRKEDLPYTFCEADGDVRPYSVLYHRHTMEIEQELGRLAKTDLQVTFTPHIAPMKRGMLSNIYVRLTDDTLDESQLYDLYCDYYADHAFVRPLKPGQLCATRHVIYSNYIDLSFAIDRKTGITKIFSALDNLGKGAASQAVQAFNLMQGYPETTGLLTHVGLL